MKPINKFFNPENRLSLTTFIILTVIFILIIGWDVYSYNKMDAMTSQITVLRGKLFDLTDSVATTTSELRTSIDQTHASLSNALTSQQQDVGNIQQQLGGFQSEVGNLSGTLNTLQKLSKTDPELLKKYSKVFFLSENYVPARLAEIPLSYQYSDTKQLLFHTDVMSHLLSMINSASSTGIKLYVSSAYRSFAEQRALKVDYRMTYGAGTANSFSADQGYSGHQLGTAVDMITTGLGGVLDGFEIGRAHL